MPPDHGAMHQTGLPLTAIGRQDPVNNQLSGVKDSSASIAWLPPIPSVGSMAEKTAGSGAVGRGGPLTARGGAVVGNREWRAGLRFAAVCAAAFSGLALLLDGASGHLTVVRAVVWAATGVVVLALLVPPRVVAGDGWLAVRNVVRNRRVRTDALVVVRLQGAVAQSLLLRDTGGRWVAVDVRLLLANPLLWHRLETAALRSHHRGTLQDGLSALRQVADRVDGPEARALLRDAGLEG